MTYSMARLEHALWVFRDSQPYRFKRGHDAKYLEEHLEKHYNTRNGGTFQTKARSVKFLREVNWDWEPAGIESEGSDAEFDPGKGKKRHLKSQSGGAGKLRKLRCRQVTVASGCRSGQGGGKPNNEKITTFLTGKMQRKSKEITLELKSDTGREFLKQMAENLGTDSDSDGSEDDLSPVKGKTQSLWRKSRFRLSARPPTTTEAAARRLELEIRNAADEEETPICSGRSSRNRMVENQAEKTTTTTCQRCDMEERRCRWAVGSGSARTCKSCKKDGMECVVKPEVDEEVEQEAAESCRFSLLECCSDQKESTKDLMEDSRLPPSRGDDTTKSSPIVLDTPSPPPMPPRSRQSPLASTIVPHARPWRTGRTKTIVASFAYPMDFMLYGSVPAGQSMATASKKCHFCADYRYGILGLGRIRVEIIQYGASVKYEETGGGHIAAGHEATRMCMICALNRLHTSNCPKYAVTPICHPDPTRLDYQDWMRHLVDSTARREVKPRHPCCSICRGPATWSCGAGANKMLVRGPFPRHFISNRKCVLLLCEGCKEVVDSVGMNKQVLKGKMRRQSRSPRADTEFLFIGSDLHMAWDVKSMLGG